MTEFTKLLFGAPWHADYWCVMDTHGRSVATSISKTDAKRLSFLPELYDALTDAADIVCALSGQDARGHCEDPSLYQHVREWRKLLQSIKDA